MIKATKSTLIALSVIGLGITSVISVGFAAWTVGVSGNDLFSVQADASFQETDSGFGIASTPLKMGRYFYENNGGVNSETGQLVYTISFNPSHLPQSMKNEQSSGYRFTLSGFLRLNNATATDLFNDTYIASTMALDSLTTGLSVSSSSVSITKTSVTDSSQSYAARSFASFAIVSASRGNVTESFSLTFTFQRALLWANVGDTSTSYRDLLKGSKFVLRLETGGAVQ